jgi:hypothetical protein
MSKNPAAPGGSDPIPGGDPENKPNSQDPNPADPGEGAPRQVSYDSYKKAVDEAKAAKKRLDDFERKEKDREEASLKEQGNFKKLLEQREAELKDTQKKLTDLDSKISNSRKLNSVLGAIGSEIPKQYWGLIDLEQIAVDPDSGLPDESSIKKAAEEFRKQFPEVIKTTKGKLPNDAPGGAGSLGFAAEIKAAKTQKEFDAVMAKYGKV